jgi:hypothetical protein
VAKASVYMTCCTLVVAGEGELTVPDERRVEILDWLEQDETLCYDSKGFTSAA